MKNSASDELRRPTRAGRRFGRGTAGTTLVELTLAIVVTSMVGALVFSGYRFTVARFHDHANAAARTNEMILSKAVIDRLFRDIAVVERVLPSGVKYRGNGRSQTESIVFRNNTVIGPTRKTPACIEEFKIELHQPDPDAPSPQRLLILWEARVGKGGWIGGAREVVSFYIED